MRTLLTCTGIAVVLGWRPRGEADRSIALDSAHWTLSGEAVFDVFGGWGVMGRFEDGAGVVVTP